MRRGSVVFAVGVFGLGLVVEGCTSADNLGLPPNPFEGPDAAAPGLDASAVDGTVSPPDATTPFDAAAPDATTPEDTGAPIDTGSDAADASAADTGTDAGVQDSGSPDTSIDAGDCVLADGGLSCDVIIVDVANGGAGDLTSYTVPIVVDTRPYVGASKLKADCSDLAAYAGDHVTPLPYWVSSAECNTAKTRLFVQVPSIAAGGTARLYLTYGSTPPLAQDGASLFLFFDDFTGTALDTTKWTHWGDGTYVEASGILTTQHANLLVSIPQVVASGTTAVGVREDGNSALGDDFEIGAGTVTAVSSPSWLWVQARTGQWVSEVSYSALNQLLSGGATFCTNENVAAAPLFNGQWYDTEFRYDLTGNMVTASWARSDGTSGTHPDSSDAGCLPAATESVILGLDHGTGTGSDPITHVDWAYVRSVASPEPTVTVTPPAWVVGDGGADGGADAGASDASGD